MEKIQARVYTAFYIRHVYAYQLRNIEDGTVILYYENHGSLWINRMQEAEKWLSEQESKRFDQDKVKRPSTKWVLEAFFSADVKVVLDRQPLVGSGPLPEWLRKLAQSRAMFTLDTFNDNLCLWRCISVYRGALPHRSTNAARELAKGVSEKPQDIPKTSMNKFEKVEIYLNAVAAASEWLCFQVYTPDGSNTSIATRGSHTHSLSAFNVTPEGAQEEKQNSNVWGKRPKYPRLRSKEYSFQKTRHLITPYVGLRVKRVRVGSTFITQCAGMAASAGSKRRLWTATTRKQRLSSNTMVVTGTGAQGVSPTERKYTTMTTKPTKTDS